MEFHDAPGLFQGAKHHRYSILLVLCLPYHRSHGELRSFDVVEENIGVSDVGELQERQLRWRQALEAGVGR